MKTKSTSFMNMNAKSFLIFIVFLVVSLNIQAQYCSATGGCSLYISRVQFSNIDNSSSCSNYYDYSASYTANIKQGYSYQITVSNPYQYSYDTCDVWIDWNKNSIFENTTESFRLTNAVNAYVGTISVPVGADLGETKMRIRLRYGGNFNPCGDAGQSYGEVEDYKVNVSASYQMVIGGILFNQLNGITIPGASDVKIACIRVITDGSYNPLYLKNINLSTLGSSINISNANLFYTQHSSVFSLLNPVGLQNNSPGSQLLFSDSLTLLTDTNYFWLTYSVTNSAPIGAHLKANLVSVNINDTNRLPTLIDTAAFVQVVAPLSGTYHINAQGNGNYLSFSDAVNELIIRGVSGPVVFSVDTGTYTDQFMIPSIAGASAMNTITFKSTNNDKTSVNLTHTSINDINNYTILLENAAYIYFQDLTISSGYSSNYSKVIYMTGECHHINFTGNNIFGTETYSGYNSSMALIHIMSSNLTSYISITNNTFRNGSYGVMFDTYGPMSSNNTISGNIFNNQGGYGIFANNQSNLTISGNNIYSGLYSSSYYGIYFNNGNGILAINKNRIVVGNFNNMYGIYIYSYIGSAQTSSISNNFVSLHSNFFAEGITLDNSTIGVYYNSVNIVGNCPNSTALNIQNSSGLVFKNNIYSNSAFGKAINASSNCNQCQSDHNNIYSNGIFANLNGSNIPNLYAWTAATQVDSNSLSVYPQFLSDTNLHTANISMNGRAVPISGITTDIDEQSRNIITPDMGADEYTPPAYDLQLLGFVNTPSGCGLTNNEKIEVIIQNGGTSNYIAGNASIHYDVDITQQLVNETINRNIASGDTIHYTFMAGADLSVNTFMLDTTFFIQSWLDYTVDVNPSNDYIQTSSFSRFVPQAPVVSDTIIPYATAVNLNAQVLQDYIPIWYESTASLNHLKVGNPYSTPFLYSPDTFYVASKKGGLDYGIIGFDNTYGSSNPFYSYYSDSRTQIIYTADEMRNAGFVAGNITSLAFNVYSLSSTTMNGFTINMKNTSLSNITSYVETGWTNVYSGAYSVPGYGWQEIVFQSPFIWDGNSNILINVCFDNTTYGSSSNVYCSYLPGLTCSGAGSNMIGCSMTTGSADNYRPNIQLKGTKMGNACESNRTALHVGISNTPNNDIGITSILSPSTAFEITNPSIVEVVVKNFGNSLVDTMFVSYQKNDTSAVVTEQIIRSLASGDTLHYSFAQNVNLSALGIYHFKAFTHLLGDIIYVNDTIYKTVENFTYCAATTNYGCYYTAINSFVVNTLANTNSGCNAETGSHIIYPQSTFTTELEKGIIYPFTITPVNNNYGIGYGIWIDLNQDGDFDDDGEFLFNTYTYNTPVLGNMSIPTTYSNIGPTRLRVRAIRYYNLYSNNSCTPFSEYGETEDYTVSLTAATPMVLDSILFKQTNGMTLLGNQNINIARIKIVTEGSISPFYLKNIQLNSLGSYTNITDARLFYTSNSSVFSNMYPYWSQINSPSNQLLFTDSILLLPGANYFWLTYSVANSAVIGSHLKAILESVNINNTVHFPTSIDTMGYVEIVAPLNGTYVINAQGNGNYLSFNQAVNDLNYRGISGPVIFNVDTGTYYEQILIPSIAGISNINTITFKSTNNDKNSVNLTYNQTSNADNYTVLLQNTSYINFQNLSITSGYSSNYSRPIYITGVCNNINFTGNNIIGSETYSGNNNSLALIYYSPSSSTSNLSILNNNFINGSYGVIFDAGNTMNNTIISGNKFTNQGGFGIYLYNQSNSSISNNNIFSGLNSSYFYGIYFNSGSGNVLISKNRIAVNNFTNMYGIYLSYFTGNIQSSSIVNNFISLHPTSSAAGITLQYATIGVYYNSINIVGNNSNSYAMTIQNSSGLSIKNNIISNTASGTAFNIGTSCNQCKSDYNNIYSNGTLGTYLGNILSSLSAWKASSLMDTNSVSVFSQFISDTNLHLVNIALNGKAVPISGITTDIDDQLRNISTPDIGADEFNLPPQDLQLDGFYNLPSGCGLTNNEKIVVIIKNIGDSAYTSGNAAVKFQINLPQQMVNETINRNIASGDTIHYTFVTGANLSVTSYQQDTTFLIKSWIDYTADLNHSNDSASSSLWSKYLHAAPIVSDTIIPYAHTVSLSAQVLPSYIPIWYESLQSVNSIKIGNPFITPILYIPDTFYVSSKKGGLDYATIGSETNTIGYPFYTYYHDSKTQMLYTADELRATGLQPGSITSISFNISSYATQPMYGFNIQMQNTSLSNLSGFVSAGFSYVYTATYTAPGNGWKEIVLQNPFNWDGVSNILINICFDNGSYTSNTNVYSSITTGKVWHQHADNSTGCAFTGGGAQTYRPNIRLKGMKLGSGCESNRATLHVGLNGFPAKDIGVTSILSPNSGFELSNLQNVGVVVKNYGVNTIDTMLVSYKKADTSLAVTETIIRSLASGDTLHYFFTQKANLSTVGIYNFKAFTHLTGDTVFMNDTIQKTVENYTYCNPICTYACSAASINNFVVNTIANNASGCNAGTGGYIAYPENTFTTTFQKSVTYPFSITPTINTSIGYGIWIDLNNDGDFEDAGEFLYSSYNSNLQFTGSISIPSTYSYTGKTRMRVRAVRYYNVYSYDACTSFPEYGETEDYIITLVHEPFQKDVQLASIIKPNSTSTYQLIPNDVTVQIRNVGLDTIAQIPLTYIFNAQSPVSYTWNGQLLPQQIVNVNLSQITATFANNTIKVYTGLVGDMDQTNDTIYKSFVALPAPALMHINPDTVFGYIASCDSAATQTVSFAVSNTGFQPLYYKINQNLGMSDNFENGLNKWIYNGSWGLINQGYNGGYGISESPSGSYGDGWSYYIQLKDSLYISNKDSCKIQYMLKFALESCCDRINAQISVNNAAWITIRSDGGTGNEAYNLKQTSFSSNVNNGDYIKFRFLFTSDGSVTSDGVVIDDFSINGIQNGDWATLNKTLDTVATGNTSTVNVTFKVGMLFAGIHSQVLNILSNDPLIPNKILPMYLTITGAPEIFIKDSIRNFPSVMAGVASSQNFKIYNIGCDSLKITAVNHTDAAYSTVFPSFVMPRDSVVITVNFISLIQGVHNDTLTIMNNSSLKHLYVSQTVIPTPKITLAPDSFLVNSTNCFDTLIYNMMLKNTGNTTLNWNAYFSKGAEKAIAFNGTNSEVRFGNFGQMPQKGCVEFWMKSNINAGFKVLYTTSGLNYNWKGINIYQSDNYLYLIVGNDNGSTYNSYLITSNIDYGKWHHVAVSWDVAQNKVWTYFDGNVISNASYNPYWATTISDVRIGVGYSATYGYYFNGEMDAFRMWSDYRSQTDISNHFKESLVIPTPSLMGLWGFDEPSGDTAYCFNNSKNGVLYSATRTISAAKIENPGIDVYPSNGVLADGDSSSIQVTFVTTGINSGSHYSGIGIASNDPLRSLVIVPTHLVLSGSPQLHLLTNNMNMSNIMAGASITDSMQFVNMGCDTLKVTNITHSNAVFTLNQSTFNVLPRDTAKLKITFHPINIGNYFDSLQFITNAGIQQFYVHAVAVAAPIASVNPTSFRDTLTVCNQSLTRNFKIRNAGNEVLNWNGIMGLVGISDNFETGLSKWTTNGSWGVINQGYNSGFAMTESPSGSYGNGWNVYIQLKDSIYIANKDSCKVQYMLKRNMESCCDYLNTQISVNGSSWISLSPSFNSTEDWSLKQFPFASYVNNGDYIKFRFLFTSDGSVIGDGVLIDNFSINSLNFNDITPSSGTVAVGDSTTVQLHIDGLGLINGKYISQIIINTNDPVHQQILIPIQFVVKANPIITITTNPLIMDTVMIGAISTKPLYIKNTGCDSLKITNITHSFSEFTVNPVSLIILPRDSAAVNITFSTLAVANYIDTLKIYSNAGNLNIAVKAKAVGAPEIITLPDLISVNLSCDSSTTASLKMKNPGIVPLNWSAFISNQEKGAMKFNGISNYINSGAWTPGNKWTVEAWVKPDVLSLGNKLIAGSFYSYAPWGICMIDKKFAAIYRSAQSGYTQNLIVSDTMPAGNWYHVACAFNGTTIRLYVNGQLLKSAVVNSIYTAYANPYIGGDPGYGNYFSGSIDEVRIWDRERSQSQISYAMNHILVGNEIGLLAYWPFNKMNGTTVNDFSSNAHNGTVNGAIYTSSASPTLGWVNLSNSSGIINVGDSTQINININRHLLAQGSYPFKLIIQSDDPVKPYDTTLITVNAQYNLMPVDIGNDTNLCTGNSLLLSAGSYASYTWNNNTHNSTLNATSSGVYNVFTTDVNGCNYRDTIQVGLTQSPIANAGVDKSVCQGGSVSLNGSASGGSPDYQYLWKDQLMNIVSTSANYYFTPSGSLMHFLSVTDNNGCVSAVLDTVNIIVNQKPIVNAGNDTSISLGTSVILNASITGGTYPYTISWSPNSLMSASNILNPILTPTNSSYYYINVTDANSCTANDNILVDVKYIVSGSVVYDNSLQTPMPNVWVFLTNTSNVIKDSVLTSASGTFVFPKVDYGNCLFYAKPTAVFGGVNSTDALGIRRHIVSLSPLSGVNLSAADVNKSNTVSSADALQVLRRTIGLITSFTSGDWTSEIKSLYVYSNGQNTIIKVLCMGDVNASYNIYSTKATEGSPELECNSTLNLIAGETFNLPIRVKQNIQAGAVTLYAQFPDHLIDIMGVSSNGSDVEYSLKKGVLSIGLYNEKGITLNDHILLSIKCVVKPDATSQNLGISLLNHNEIADIEGKVLTGLQLETACMNIVEKYDEFKMEDNFPNPFYSTTTIRIYVPEVAGVRLSILNTLGVEIKSISTEKLSIGWHDLQIDARDVSQGAYMYRLQAVSATKTFDQTRRMMIIR